MTETFWKSAIVIGLLLVLTYLLIQSATPNPLLHERTLAALHKLELNDAKLNRDLLRTRAGLLRHYDSLVQAVSGLYAALATLRAGGQAAYGEATADINRYIENLAVAVTQKEALVDTFKSDNALLQNSLMYFTHLSHELSTSTEHDLQAAATEIGMLANAMLWLMRNPQEKAAGEIAASLNRLEGV